MKQSSKTLNLIVTLTLLVLSIVCVCNVTFAYFTSINQTGGDINFPGLDVKFVYKETSNGVYKTAETNSLQLYSADGTITRGEAFQLSLTNGGAAIHSLGIQNMNNSCSAYVRFWIDAYPVDLEGNKDMSVNYGKYFVLAESENYSNSKSSVANSRCYFGINVLNPDETTALSLGNSLTLKDVSESDAFPANLLGEKFQISISFEVVQSANKAYLSTFGEYGDEKGYCTDWR